MYYLFYKNGLPWIDIYEPYLKFSTDETTQYGSISFRKKKNVFFFQSMMVSNGKNTENVNRTNELNVYIRIKNTKFYMKYCELLN